jgi:hypothetical protein
LILPVGRERFGMPLNAEHKSVGFAFDRFDHPIFGARADD